MHSSPTGRPQGRDSAAAEPRRHEHRRRGARPAPRATPRRQRPRRARRRVPVYNEEADLEPSVRRLHAHLATHVPVPLPDHDRRQRQHRRHPARSRSGWPARSRPSRRSGSRRRAAAGRCGRSGRASDARRARLLRRRPVDRPRRAAAAGRPADLRALGPRDRHPARPRAHGWSAGRSGSSSRAATTCCCAAPCRPVHRRPVRLQGDPRGRREAAAAAGRGHRLVLRHRAAGARRAGRPADPRGAGRLGRRPGLAGSTSSPPPLADLRGIWRVGRRSASGALPVAELRAQLGRAPLAAERPRSADAACHASSSASRRSASRARSRYLLLFLLFRGVIGGDRGERRRAAAHQRRQHRREPAADLRRARRPGRRPPPGPGPDHLRPRAGADDGRARAARTRSCPTRAGPSSWPSRRRQRRRHRAAVRPVPRAGSSARAPSPSRRPRAPRRTRHDRHPERVGI